MSAQAADASAFAVRTPVWLVAAISATVGLGYAYAVWNAVGNLIAIIQAAVAQGLSLNALGWFLWLLAAAVPVLVWALAFSLGRRRRAFELILIMATGLCLVAVFWLNVVTYATLNTSTLVS